MTAGPTTLILTFSRQSTQKILSYVIGKHNVDVEVLERASCANTRTGWFCVLGWQAGIAGQSFSVGSQIQGLIVLNNPTYVPQAWHSTLLAIGVVSVCVIVNTFLVRKLPLIEGFVLILHILGFFAVLIPLWIFAPRAPSSEVWTGLQNNAGWPSGGLAFLVGLTTSVNSLTGPDSAVHMGKIIFVVKIIAVADEMPS